MGELFRRKYRDKQGEVREGAKWWIKYFHNGTEYRESSGSTKKTDAERLLKQREGEIVDRRFRGLQVEKITFEEITEDMIRDFRLNAKKERNIQRVENAIKRLRGHFAGFRAREITTEHIKKYIEDRKAKLAANGTINRELAVLKRSYSLAVKAEKLDRRPHIPTLEENNVRSFFFEHEDYLKLREALPDHLKPVIVLAYHSGMRREEMLSLTWDKVDLVRGRITLSAGSTKNKDARIIPLAGELYEAIQEQAATVGKQYPGCPYVFPYRGRRMKDTRDAWERALKACAFPPVYLCRVCGAISEYPAGTDYRAKHSHLENGKKVRSRKQAVSLACHECGRPELRRYGRTMHDFRRSTVRNAVRSGVPESICMKLSGHKTRSVFDRYNIVNEADLEAATARIMEYHRQLEATIEARKPYTGPSTGSKTGSINESENHEGKYDTALDGLTIENGKEMNGAGGRNRTDMELPPEDFESSASTSFTTPARPQSNTKHRSCQAKSPCNFIGVPV